MAEFLLELFSEEIPARFQKQAADDLLKLFTDKLTAQGLAFSSAKAHVTPRRLALVIDGLPTEQPARSEEKKGPKTDAPQAAIDGFLKSAGIKSLDACEQRDTPKGKVWFYVENVPGQPTANVLWHAIEQVILEFPWKKSMNWGEGRLKWVRPLRNILALFEGKTLENPDYKKVEVPDNKKSEMSFYFPESGDSTDFIISDQTEGHRFLTKGKIKVSSFADYEKKLRAAHVILDREERKQIIKAEAEKALAAKGVSLKQDEGLLEEVCGLVEWPVPLVGKIDDQFMGIPPEVLITTMKNNQKYFSSIDQNGKMSPYFVVTANITSTDGGAAIIDGNQRVLRARFADAKFFWDVDRGMKLADRVPALESITFHAKLGNLASRVKRMEYLADKLAIPGAKADDVSLAARLAKADLTTGMVGEFPELQGIMGGYYARHDGYSDTIANAITEHYSPLGPNDKCPGAPVSVAVALAEKLDTLVGFFAINEKPTGSKDPYALRRAALGTLRLIIENNLRLDLQNAFKSAYGAYNQLTNVMKDFRVESEVLTDLSVFFADRLKVMLKDKGFRHDQVAAVFAPENMTDIVGQMAKLEALQKALGSDDGKALVALYKRAGNILRIEEKKDGKSYSGPANDNDLAEEQEKKLSAALKTVSPVVVTALKSEKHAEAMQQLITLRAPLDAFFDKVTVNAEKPELRTNRLRLLAQVRDTLNQVADLSQIEGE